MNKVDNFISELPTWKINIINHLRVLIKESHPAITESIKYNTPFYEYKGQLCYILVKPSKIELSFSKGYKLNPLHKGLVKRNRKQVRTLLFRQKTGVDEMKVRELMQEALMINDIDHKK